MLKIVKHTVQEVRVYAVEVPEDWDDLETEELFMSELAYVTEPYDVYTSKSVVEICDPTYHEEERFKDKAVDLA